MIRPVSLVPHLSKCFPVERGRYRQPVIFHHPVRALSGPGGPYPPVKTSRATSPKRLGRLAVDSTGQEG